MLTWHQQRYRSRAATEPGEGHWQELSPRRRGDTAAVLLRSAGEGTGANRHAATETSKSGRSISAACKSTPRPHQRQRSFCSALISRPMKDTHNRGPGSEAVTTLQGTKSPAHQFDECHSHRIKQEADDVPSRQAGAKPGSPGGRSSGPLAVLEQWAAHLPMSVLGIAALVFSDAPIFIKRKKKNQQQRPPTTLRVLGTHGSTAQAHVCHTKHNDFTLNLHHLLCTAGSAEETNASVWFPFWIS